MTSLYPSLVLFAVVVASFKFIFAEQLEFGVDTALDLDDFDSMGDRFPKRGFGNKRLLPTEAEEKRGFVDKRGFADKRDFDDEKRGFVDRKRGFVDRKRGFADKKRGFGDKRGATPVEATLLSALLGGYHGQALPGNSALRRLVLSKEGLWQ